jgi:hypothetical protein
MTASRFRVAGYTLAPSCEFVIPNRRSTERNPPLTFEDRRAGRGFLAHRTPARSE